MILLKILVLRHGQSAANAQGIIQGQGGRQGGAAWPLTEIGRSQAQHANKLLVSLASSDGSEDSYFWRAYSSDLKRAKNTAEIALAFDSESNKSQLLHESERLRLDERLREFALGVRWV